MVFCSKCGEEIPKDACYCPGCGVRIRRRVEVEAGGPWDKVEEGFERMGEELEKAFERVGREIERAFEGEREEELVVCPECREENVADAKFCYKCGGKLR